MKLYIKVLLFIVVLGVAAPFIMKRPDGRPLMSVSDLAGDSALLTSFGHMTRLLGFNKDSATLNGSDDQRELTTVHKWQDEDGNWHFSDDEPENVASETLKINPNQNILEMNDAKLLKKIKGESEIASTHKDLAPPTDMIPGMPTIDQAKKAMENAKAVQGMLDNHYKQLEGI
ncbi:MAG: DUF4124 domain-containing protein [Gammaproteobacteria bacterium]|nr:DUF4124 domain-containing protein [Gammaproteobacteria bacterium]